MILISVIIPVYNSERYLFQCLESVLNQNIDSTAFEVIVINDGSTDDSNEIILKFAAKYPNLKYLIQRNKGVSAARNAGLDVARGEYIVFVDADDLLYINSLLDSYNYASSNNLDLLYGKINYIAKNGEITGEFSMESDEIKIEDGFNHQRRGYIFGLYKKNTLGDLRFMPDVPIAEDALFNLFFHAKAKRISYFNQSFYKYRKTPGSAINSDLSKTGKAFNGYMIIIDEITKFIGSEQKNLSSAQLNYFNRPLFMTAKMALESNIIATNGQKRYFELVSRINKMNNKDVYKSLKNVWPFYGRKWSIFIIYYYYRYYIKALKWKLFRFQ